MRKGTNGKMEGEKNFAKLKALFARIVEIPMRGGKPNKTEIARLAGLKDRQPLDNNSDCKELLTQALKTKMYATVTRQDEERGRLERRVRCLEIRLDKEMAENFEHRRRERKLQHIEKIIEGGGHFIP